MAKCYMFNYQYCIQNPDWQLVHGNCINPKTKQKQGHAWCEKEIIIDDKYTITLVYDAVGGFEMPKDAYYQIGQCELIVKYTANEAINMALKYGHYGYWEYENKMGITNN